MKELATLARVDVLHCGGYAASMGDLSVKLTPEAIEYAEQKFLRLFGKDSESKELANWFKGLQQTALSLTACVHCLGMRSPLPFERIYQPNRILVCPDENEIDAGSSFAHEDRVSRSILRGLNQKSITVEEFLKRDQDALIFGFPGWGKTTFLHHIFRSTVKTDEILPVLIIISLRRPTAVDDLERYVDACSYEKAVAAYKTDLITFAVPGARETKLKLLDPVLENRMKDYKPPTS